VDEYFVYVRGDYEEIDSLIIDPDTKESTIVKKKVYSRDPEPITITGLTLFLGFQSKSSLDDYCKDSEEFAFIIKKAKLLVEHNYEKGLHEEYPTGKIFALKQMGWRDKQDVDVTTNGEKLTCPSVILPGGATLDI
jgi:hypothetical protein